MKIGIIGFSFALTKKEPNLCNVKLAEEVDKLRRRELDDGNEAFVAIQWEIAEALKDLETKPDYVVNQKKGIYLNSDMVMDEVAQVLRAWEITHVIVVANPFLHLAACRTLAKKLGFIILKRKINWIGFCKDSLQWWTRNPMNFILYAIRAKIFGKRG